MALFKKSKKNTEKKSQAIRVSKKDLTWVIKKPRITEKGAVVADSRNAYPFEIHKDATKKDVSLAISNMYNIIPIKVNIVNVPSKIVRNRRGQMGKKGGLKKAYVYLKKGDKIEFV